MSSNIQQELLPDEQIVAQGKLSWTVFIVPVLCIPLYFGIIWLIYRIITYCTTSLVVTDKRICGKTGLINRKELTSPISQIQGVRTERGLFGMIFNYQTVVIMAGITTYKFKYIGNAKNLACVINNAIVASQSK